MVHPRAGLARSRGNVLKYILLLLALGSATLSLLTLRRAPDWVIAWKLAILAGEYGHWLVLLPLGTAVAAGGSAPGACRTVTLMLCVLATVGLLRPVFSARRIAGTLPRALAAAFGAEAPGVPVWDWGRLFFGSPRPKAALTTEVFARPDGQELKVDIYAPMVPGKPRPCVVVIHGGGWDGGDRKQLPEWNDWFVARGYVVAAISYRLAPKWQWPKQGEDVLTAIAWLKAHAAAQGIDPTRLVLMGRSAGGQIASAVGYGTHDPAIRGVIALYAPHDMPFVWSVSRGDDVLNSLNLMQQYMGGPPDGARRANYESASAQLLARADSPPTLLVHGAPDTLSWVRHSGRLAARLQELKVRHYFLSLPWATHAFDFNPDGPGSQLTGYAMDWFLARATKPARD